MKYLVVSEHAMDDIPLRLFEDRQAAFKFAKTCEPATQRRTGWEASDPVAICVYTFDEQGNFRRTRRVRDLETEVTQ